MKRKLTVLILAMVMVLNLVACGGKATTAEEYYTKPVIKAALDEQIKTEKEALMAQMAGICTDMGYEVNGNTFTYWYNLSSQLPTNEATKEQLENSMSEAQLTQVVSDIEEECGVEGVTVEFVYYKADGSEFCKISHTNN